MKINFTKKENKFLQNLCKQNFNKLTNKEKYILLNSQDMGFWFDNVLDNSEILKEYNTICEKIGRNDLLIAEID